MNTTLGFGTIAPLVQHLGALRLFSRRRSVSVQRTSAVRCCAVASGTERLRAQIAEIAGSERGIFGMEEEDRERLDVTIRELEKNSPIKQPTADNAAAAHGRWRLLYTNLEILGRKRVQLAIGTRSKAGFVKLGEFIQEIDAGRGESRNVVHFDIVIGGKGSFTITAQYRVESEKRVIVEMSGSRLEPEKLERLLGENDKLLTQIFDPTGFLDITYLDGELRIGRDNKGHVFVLEKTQ